MVAVKETGEKYRCNVCGNEVEVTKAGGGELVCCGQPMQLMTEEAPAPDIEAEEAPEVIPEEEPGSESEEDRPVTF